MKQVNRMIPTTKQDHRLPNVLSLREGQIVTGKVLKFFPGNKAMINLSGHQVVAQLDASLEANQNYLMQVKGTSPGIQLQVVNQQAVHSYEEAAQSLLTLAGIKGSKLEQSLLAHMLKQQLPIQKNMVAPLIQLARQNHVPNQSQILSELIHRQLPLKQEVFNAIHQRINRPISFTNVIDQIQNHLKQSQSSLEAMELNNRLNLLNAKPISNQNLLESFVLQSLKEVSQSSKTTFQLFQKAGLISNNVKFQDWSNTWSNWSKQNQVQFSLNSSQSSLPSLPYNITASQISETVNQISHQQLSSNHTQILRGMTQQLALLKDSSNILTNQQINSVQRGIQSNIWSQLSTKLPNQVQSTMQQIQTNLTSQNWDQVTRLLQTNEGQVLQNQLNQLINNQVSSSEVRALSFWQTVVSLNSGKSIQEFSVNHFKNFLQLTQVDANANQDYPTISSLVRSIQGQGNQSQLNDSLHQLNQIIQSMHLSQTETNHRDWTAFTTQFPKDMLGLNQDLFMEFEGKKQEDGTIHPKQCRVIFYLDLPHLKETIMDMHVQNSHVDLSVFHTQPEKLKKITMPLIPLLNEKLLDKDYLSVNVQFKPIHEKTNKQSPVNYTVNEWRQGVDFRV